MISERAKQFLENVRNGTLELGVSSVVPNLYPGLKHRSVRDYVRMRFGKAAPAAGRLGNIAKTALKHPIVQGIGAGAVVSHLSKRNDDTKEEKTKRSKASYNGAVGAVYGGRLLHSAAKIHSLSRKAINAKNVGQIRTIRNVVGGSGAVIGALGARSVYKAFKAKGKELSLSKFSEFQDKLESKGMSAKEAGGIAYNAGKKKYGKKKMAMKAKQGKMKKDCEMSLGFDSSINHVMITDAMSRK